ncbi:uncharacterized protein LOC123882242 [Trifolium pratense]|uniref:uncharacterized protein LOC123882242 n=1 Tax=Trifolium pratense TaxID=57577 RepID=UPI001E698149|nr:uncharacterized protein LOC123882242 [Trifolium pratense]
MAEENSNSNGNTVYVEHQNEQEQLDNLKHSKPKPVTSQTLPQVLNRLVSAILFPEPANDNSLLHRIKISVADNTPLLPEASKNSANDVIIWTRRGSPLRALLVISVGTVSFVSLTGLLVFTLFFLAATINAIVISLLMSLAAAGGFLALFFVCATAIYIGSLSIAIFVISVTTFWTIVAILIISGWIGFFYTVWLITRKSFGFAKHSLSVTGSAITSYSTSRATRHLVHTDSN